MSLNNERDCAYFRNRNPITRTCENAMTQVSSPRWSFPVLRKLSTQLKFLACLSKRYSFRSGS